MDELIALAALPAVAKLQEGGNPPPARDVRDFLAVEPRLDPMLAHPVLAPPDVLGQPNLSTPATRACVVLDDAYQALLARPELSTRAARQLVRLSALESGLGSLQSVLLPSHGGLGARPGRVRPEKQALTHDQNLADAHLRPAALCGHGDCIELSRQGQATAIAQR